MTAPQPDPATTLLHRTTSNLIRVVHEYRKIRRVEPNGDAREHMKRAKARVDAEEKAT